jgi:hypothetical protein
MTGDGRISISPISPGRRAAEPSEDSGGNSWSETGQTSDDPLQRCVSLNHPGRRFGTGRAASGADNAARGLTFR